MPHLFYHQLAHHLRLFQLQVYLNFLVNIVLVFLLKKVSTYYPTYEPGVNIVFTTVVPSDANILIVTKLFNSAELIASSAIFASVIALSAIFAEVTALSSIFTVDIEFVASCVAPTVPEPR